MNSIEIRGHVIKSGSKIAVIKEGSKDAILAKAKEYAADPSVEAVEWRIDAYDGVFEIRFEVMPETIAKVREALGDKILMYTFRDTRIGGEHPTTCMYHSRLNNLAINSGAGDLITVEWYDEPDAAQSNVENAHAGGKLVVASWCTDEAFTAAQVEEKLVSMLDSGAEMLEFGALCRSEEEKDALVAGVRAFKGTHLDTPVIASAKSECGCEEKTVF